jgi:hypothetical protein
MKPILFNTDEVKAILDGRKTQTRRPIKPKYKDDEYGFNVITNPSTGERWVEKHDDNEASFCPTRYVNPKYEIGDILYAKETYLKEKNGKIHYKTDGEDLFLSPSTDYGTDYPKWRPSIHMPKEAARIFLRITAVRVERLKDITVEDCYNEGLEKQQFDFVKTDFIELWDSCYPNNPYKSNPWVWVYEFERCEKPEVTK